MLAASTFAFVALTRPDGSASAEEAVEELFAAIEQEDAIGVMEALPPSEREVILEPMVAAVGELQRLGLLDSFTLEDVPGADIEVDGLTLQSTNLGQGVTKVRVTGGSITGTVIPDEVPIGPRTRDLAEQETGEPIDIPAESDTESLADADLELVAIEEDGGWHVSLFYTIAEYARGDEAPLPQFGSDAITPIGSDTPEGAVRGLLEAGVALDLGRAVGHLPPDEMRVLYDYVPLALDEANEGAAELRADGFSASLDRLDLHAEGDGETRRVTVDGLDLTGQDDQTTMHYTWDGTCTVVEVTEPEYGRFAPIDPETGELGEPEPASDTTTTRAEICSDGRMTVTEDGEQVDDIDGINGPLSPIPFGTNGTFGQTVTVVEHDGRWYVSPTRTVADSMLSALRGLEGDDIDQWFEDLDSWFGGPSMDFEEIEGIEEGPTGTMPPFEQDDPYVICNEVFDELDPDATDAEWDAASDAYDQCLRDHGVEPEPVPDYVGSPRLAGGHVLLPGEDAVTGYNLDGTASFAGPACAYGDWPAAVRGSTATIEVVRCEAESGTTSSELVAVDGANGAELWRRPISDTAWVVTGATAVLELEEDSLTVLDLQTGAERWTEPTQGVHNATLDDTTVYLDGGGSVTAHDLTTGEDRWSIPMDVTMLDSVSGALYVRDEDNTVHRLDPASGAALWSTKAGDPTVSHTAVAGATADVVVIVSDDGFGQLTVFDRESGALLWSRDEIDEYVGVAVGGGSVVATDYDGSVLVLDHRTGAPVTGVVVQDYPWGLDIEGNVLALVSGSEDGTGDPTVSTITLP